MVAFTCNVLYMQILRGVFTCTRVVDECYQDAIGDIFNVSLTSNSLFGKVEGRNMYCRKGY